MQKKYTPQSDPSSSIQKSGKKSPYVHHEKLIQHKLTKFEQDYNIISKLGEGSFGEVFKVEHKNLKLHRALKLIHKSLNNQHSSRQQIQVLIKLDHPNIVKLYQFYEIDNYYYLVTQIFDGRELFDEIIQDHPFTEYKAAEITRQILKALIYTHKYKVVHRDIKAENVLVRRQQGKFVIKLIDWGLGTVIKDNGTLVRRCGTPQYAAPEVFLGSYNEKCDLWSLGIIVYVMLAGEMPFKGKNNSETIALVQKGVYSMDNQIWKKVSNQGKEFIKQLLVKDPKYRLSAQDAMKSKWINIYTKQEQEPLELKGTLLRLKQFHTQNSIHMAALNYITNYLSTEQQKRKLNDIFHYLDKNGDGVLELSELVAGYSKIYGKTVASSISEQIFMKLDLNKSGKLEYNEFITYAMTRKKQIPEAKLKQAFKMFDTNGDGKISSDEIKGIICADMEDLGWDQLIQGIDENGDGLIDENQFIKFMNEICETYGKNQRGAQQIENQFQTQNKSNTNGKVQIQEQPKKRLTRSQHKKQ